MRMVALCTAACLAFALAGCLGAGTSPQGAAEAEQAAQPEVPVVVYQPVPGLTARERWKKAIDLLEVGQSGQARAELVVYLREKPTSSLARGLIQQIDSDPVAYLGQKHFLYRMKSGESLSIVAKRMLGDALKFHILARYNEIENPSKMVVGQLIKVPGNKPPPQVAESLPDPETPDPETPEAQTPEMETLSDAGETGAVEQSTTETGSDGLGFAPDPAEEAQQETQTPADDAATSEPDQGAEAPVVVGALPDQSEGQPAEIQTAPLESLMQQAVAKVQEGDYAGAGNNYEEAIELYPDDSFIRQMAALNYLTYADTLESSGDREKAALILVRARQLDPQNQEVRQRLGQFAKLDEADAFYQEGTGHQAKGDLIEAYGFFQRAVNIVPDHNLANKKLLSLTPAVAEAFYRKGLKAYRQHDLDEAIAMYDQCLNVDPAFSSCSVKRIETEELKEKYENLPPPE